MSKIKEIILLFITMVKIGLFTFGGGYAMIALLENEFVSKKKWIDKDEFLNMAVIAESTPGPIAINAATYIGYKRLGIIGSLVSTIGICIPSFIIIYTISLFFDAFLSYKIVAYAFKGIQVCVVFLIFSAGIKMLKQLENNVLNFTIILMTLLCMIILSIFSVNFSTIFYILISGFVGIFIFLIRKFRKEKAK